MKRLIAMSLPPILLITGMFLGMSFPVWFCVMFGFFGTTSLLAILK